MSFGKNQFKALKTGPSPGRFYIDRKIDMTLLKTVIDNNLIALTGTETGLC